MQYKQIQNFAARYTRRINMLTDWRYFFDEDEKFIFEVHNFLVTFDCEGMPVEYSVLICNGACKVWIDTLTSNLIFVTDNWQIRRSIDNNINKNFKLIFNNLFKEVIEGWKQK